MNKKVVKSDEEWRQQLSDEQFKVCRQKGTEPAFSGAYWETKATGIYQCICCGNDLFDSSNKFDSGTGWPSFYQAISDQKVTTKEDNSLFMKRIEVLCNQCDSHLGHVFPDGPKPTGQRFCVNSASLKLKKQ